MERLGSIGREDSLLELRHTGKSDPTTEANAAAAAAAGAAVVAALADSEQAANALTLPESIEIPRIPSAMQAQVTPIIGHFNTLLASPGNAGLPLHKDLVGFIHDSKNFDAFRSLLLQKVSTGDWNLSHIEHLMNAGVFEHLPEGKTKSELLGELGRAWFHHTGAGSLSGDLKVKGFTKDTLIKFMKTTTEFRLRDLRVLKEMGLLSGIKEDDYHEIIKQTVATNMKTVAKENKKDRPGWSFENLWFANSAYDNRIKHLKQGAAILESDSPGKDLATRMMKLAMGETLGLKPGGSLESHLNNNFVGIDAANKKQMKKLLNALSEVGFLQGLPRPPIIDTQSGVDGKLTRISTHFYGWDNGGNLVEGSGDVPTGFKTGNIAITVIRTGSGKATLSMRHGRVRNAEEWKAMRQQYLEVWAHENHGMTWADVKQKVFEDTWEGGKLPRIINTDYKMENVGMLATLGSYLTGNKLIKLVDEDYVATQRNAIEGNGDVALYTPAHQQFKSKYSRPWNMEQTERDTNATAQAVEALSMLLSIEAAQPDKHDSYPQVLKKYNELLVADQPLTPRLLYIMLLNSSGNAGDKTPFQLTLNAIRDCLNGEGRPDLIGAALTKYTEVNSADVSEMVALAQKILGNDYAGDPEKDGFDLNRRDKILTRARMAELTGDMLTESCKSAIDRASIGANMTTALAVVEGQVKPGERNTFAIFSQNASLLLDAYIQAGPQNNLGAKKVPLETLAKSLIPNNALTQDHLVRWTKLLVEQIAIRNELESQRSQAYSTLLEGAKIGGEKKFGFTAETNTLGLHLHPYHLHINQAQWKTRYAGNGGERAS